MSAMGLIQVHDLINSNNGECCYICFRPVSEKRLVQSVCLEALLSKLSNVTFFSLQNGTQVCYMCEALAKSAVRFITAVEVAARVGELFSEVTQAEWHNIESYIAVKGRKVRGVEVPDSIRRAFRIDSALRAGAAPRPLQRTDTLVVGGPARNPAAPRPAPPAPCPAPMELRSDMVVVMDQPPLVPAPLDPNMQHLRVLNQETNEFILHPMVKGTDGKIYVPSLQVQLHDNGILKQVSKAQLQKQTQNHINIPLTPNLLNVSSSNVTAGSKAMAGSKVIGRNTETGKEVYGFSSSGINNNVHKLPQSRAHLDNVELIQIDDLNIILNDNTKKRKHDEDLDKTLSEVTRLLSQNTQGACEISYELIDDDEPSSKPSDVFASSNTSSNTSVTVTAGDRSSNGLSSVAGSKRGSNVGSKRVSSTKEPVLRTDRTVDWEDKIPMDVISFMDATDPNPSERIMQPRTYPSPKALSLQHSQGAMGVICDVRSVPDMPDVPDVTPELECIDLC